MARAGTSVIASPGAAVSSTRRMHRRVHQRPGITATLEWPAGGVEDATGAGVVFPYATGTSWKCGITSVANSSMERITFS
jgi:hypothetical protein